MTRAVVDSARQVLKGEENEGVGPLLWINHGPYVFKGLEEPLEVCEVCENEETVFKAPASSEKAQRHISMEKVVQLASSQTEKAISTGRPKLAMVTGIVLAACLITAISVWFLKPTPARPSAPYNQAFDR